MLDVLKKFLNFLLGLIILTGFYFVSKFLINLLHITFPPAILGLILFAFALVKGIIKEEWVKTCCDFLMKNMAMFLVPFIGGLIVYKSLLLKNWFVIFVVIFATTTFIIVFTGLFVEWGLKFLKLYKMRKHND